MQSIRVHIGITDIELFLRYIPVLFLFFLIITAIQPVAASDGAEILYINSYHKGQDWSDKISDGITDSLGKDTSIKLYTEYLDTKNYPDEENYNNLYNLFSYKYKDKKFDVIITSDDNAFNFVLKYRESLFPDTPVVFCGVNMVSADFQENNPDFTGVLEYLHIADTIDTAIEINPKPLKRMYILTDNSQSGLSFRNELEEINEEFRDRIELVNIYDLSMNELLFEVSNMPSDSAILYIVFNRDREGEIFLNVESISLISQKSSVPLYTAVENYVGIGAVGGIVISPYRHGYLAAEEAKEIINGKNPSDIKIISDPYNYPLFDFNRLTDFAYDFSKLPAGSIILNEPETSVQIPVLQYILIILAGICLFFISLLLIISNRKIRITGELLRTSEERLSMAMHATKDGLWDWNFETDEYYISPAGLEMLGYNQGDITFTLDFWKSNIHPEDKGRIIENFDQSLKAPGKFEREYRIKTKSGTWKWIRSRGTVVGIKNNTPTRILGIFTDIDETVMYRNALLESNKKLSILSSVTRHDTLNQVTALMGYLEIMEDLFEDNREISEFIPKLMRPAGIIQQQINFTKDYEEMGIYKPEWQEVATVAKRAAITATDHKTEIIIDTGNIEIFADRMLEKVFFNLFDNAKRHGKTASVINVTFREEEDSTGIITVEDNGCGIEPDKKEEIFRKGYGGNSGYGLFLVSNILEITNIKIRETGEYNKGARFEIIIPETMWHIPAEISDI